MSQRPAGPPRPVGAAPRVGCQRGRRGRTGRPLPFSPPFTPFFSPPLLSFNDPPPSDLCTQPPRRAPPCSPASYGDNTLAAGRSDTLLPMEPTPSPLDALTPFCLWRHRTRRSSPFRPPSPPARASCAPRGRRTSSSPSPLRIFQLIPRFWKTHWSHGLDLSSRLISTKDTTTSCSASELRKLILSLKCLSTKTQKIQSVIILFLCFIFPF